MGEIECVVFARQFSELQHLIRTDVGVAVGGNISLREDEPPKILVHRMEALVENNRFRPDLVKALPRSGMRSVQSASAIPASQSSASKPRPAQPIAPPPKRLFLRVPGKSGREYEKAKNLTEIFDGTFPTFFYYSDEKRYENVPVGVAVTDYVIRELRALLGDENVILK